MQELYRPSDNHILDNTLPLRWNECLIINIVIIIIILEGVQRDMLQYKWQLPWRTVKPNLFVIRESFSIEIHQPAVE